MGHVGFGFELGRHPCLGDSPYADCSWSNVYLFHKRSSKKCPISPVEQHMLKEEYDPYLYSKNCEKFVYNRNFFSQPVFLNFLMIHREYLLITGTVPS
jgi:hypothetical protein